MDGGVTHLNLLPETFGVILQKIAAGCDAGGCGLSCLSFPPGPVDLGVVVLPVGTSLQIQADVMGRALCPGMTTVVWLHPTHPKTTELQLDLSCTALNSKGHQNPFLPAKLCLRTPLLPQIKNQNKHHHQKKKKITITFASSPSDGVDAGFQTTSTLREYLPIKLPVPELHCPDGLI